MSERHLRIAVPSVGEITAIETPLEAADHGFDVRKSLGLAKDEVWREAVDAMWEWLTAL